MKQRMIDHVKKLPSKSWFIIRQDPIKHFKTIRKLMTSNKIQGQEVTKLPKVENIQARLGKKILIFNKREFEMNM